MTAVNAGDEILEAAPAPSTGLLAGDPMMLGLPSFIVGSFALGLTLVGLVPGGLLGASLPIIMAATAVGQFVAMIWCISIGQSAPAAVFGIFGGFWASFPLLVLGLGHNWFGITQGAVAGTLETFLTSWLIVIGMLTLATLRLPIAFTGIFFFVDLALIFNLIAAATGGTWELKVEGICVLIFALIGCYCFFGAASTATGGKPLPLGRPILKG